MEIKELYERYLRYPSVQTDTRKIKQGDIYFALSGPNFDGNTFAAEALQKGAAYAVIDNAAFAVGDKCIVVDNTLQTLQQLAKYHRQQMDIPFIAITGSNGKTTTKELLAVVLSRKYITYATEGNLNNHIGVPLTILKIKKDAQMAIIEMGANHQKEIASYCEIALPDYGVITNCGKAHIEGFGGIEGVRKGKGELYDFIRETGGTIFLNTDLEYLEPMADGISEQITYGSHPAGYTGRPVMNGVFLNVEVDTDDEPVTLTTHLVGEYNFPNVLLAVAAGEHFGVSLQEIQAALAAYNPDNSRSQWLKKGNNQVILDAYNANPTSMKAAMENFAKADLPGKMLWIGGMREMGTEEQHEHAELVALIDKYEWAGVILVGKEFATVKSAHMWFENSTDAAAYVAQHPPVNSSILIKGSRGSKMEVMAAALPE
ncbi:UDP-N-acetylmuramoylalanyl-D-glutamate--2,6-diaminopimelate ligase [Flavipsychrobacter stenotrophus]|uniref:UDP-N-acetylmuramoyl-tripeptide--D-alanyl-D-alanine ligase n=1 Tax=Flavipsychrobacter stenotrophus TaxID=2077091 RepID=A0A2S7SY02_9BACT|nr:UDP-N-acetylmuramoyl-tripeptide--D-alanyl-D-alanine ligase [Flavipsychrobacter stenotrophus]PQJ11507.1 UDP-N-acetylmuramoylalanyl-D-glutamate--2,6-diaminopimelate ligase [Flavipsychrobacter stenotrophus]